MADSDDAEREPSQPGDVLESPDEASGGDPDTDPFRAIDPGPHRTGPFAGPTTGSFVIPEPEPTGDTFDAFNTDTWRFRQPPPPWYRRKDARLLLIVVAVAVIALVVSLVVLATRRDSGSDEPTSVEPAPTTTTTTTTTTVASTPSPVPPPSSTEPPPAAAPPAYYPPAAPPAPTRPPEINVTRMPMSVAPQPRHR